MGSRSVVRGLERRGSIPSWVFSDNFLHIVPLNWPDIGVYQACLGPVEMNDARPKRPGDDGMRPS